MTEDPTSAAATARAQRRAEAEYLEMPGLKLTPAQASRFWHLDMEETTAMLERMVHAGVLRRTKDGAYVLTSTG